jgi:phosphoglycolate phosphatase
MLKEVSNQNMIKENVIFWDWNGTLLDDTETCIRTMNNMLSKRDMPELNEEYYREVFGFPVVEYYNKIGFDFQKESFEQLSVEFIDAYTLNLSAAGLAPHAEKVLHHLKSKGKQNIILSAMRKDMLISSVHEKGVKQYFNEILGIDNIYAESKSHVALDYVTDKNLLPSDIVFIGDTVHDYEVAQEIGCRCILVADGHQSEERLRVTGAEIVNTLIDLIPAIVPKSL